MIRDFTSEAQEKLNSLCQEAEDEKWSCVTDGLGDMFSDWGAYLGLLDVKDYTDNMDKYHKKVIDKNNTLEGEIKEIFDKVYSIDECYRTKFASLKVANDSVIDSINKLTEVLTTNNFNNIKLTDTKYRMMKNDTDRKILMEIACDGLEENALDALTPEDMETLLDKVGEVLVDKCNAEGEKEVRFFVGPNLEFYYKVEVECGSDDANVKAAIEDNKPKLKEFMVGVPFLDDKAKATFSTDEGITIEAENDNGGAKLNIGNDYSIKGDIHGQAGPFSGKIELDDGVSAELKAEAGKFSGSVNLSTDDGASAQITIGDLKSKVGLDKDGIYVSESFTRGIDTYTFKAAQSVGKTTLDFSVETEPEDMDLKVKSSAGLIIHEETCAEWVRMPVPQPVTSPYECQVTWQQVAIGAAVVAGVVVCCVAAPVVAPMIAAAVAEIPAMVTAGATAAAAFFASGGAQVVMAR